MSAEQETESLEDWQRAMNARLEDMERRLDEIELGDFLLTRNQRIHLVIRRVAESYYIRPSRTTTAMRDMNTVEARVVAAWILMEHYGVTRGDLMQLFHKDKKCIHHMLKGTLPAMLCDRAASKRAEAIRDRMLEELPPC